MPDLPEPLLISLISDVLEFVGQSRVGHVESDRTDSPAQGSGRRQWRGHLRFFGQPLQLRVAGHPNLHLTEGPPGGPPSLPRALSPVAVKLVRELVDAAKPQ